MAQQMTPAPASKQVDNLRDNLLKALIEKTEAELAVKKADETIIAIRNVLAGIPLGQQLSAEIATETPTKP